MNRKIIRPSGIDVRTDIGPYEEALLKKEASIFRLAIRSGSFCMEMMEMQVAYVSCISPLA